MIGQEKRGHGLEEDALNTKPSATGRKLPEGQPRRGHLAGESANDADKIRPAPELLDQTAVVRRAKDNISAPRRVT